MSSTNGHTEPSQQCVNCGGSGTVPVNPRDPRDGDRTCPSCGGRGGA